MPKIKKKIGDEENKYPSKKNSINKYLKPVEKFDMKRILKERQEESEFWKRSAELGEEINAVNILFEKEIKKLKEVKSPPPKFGFVVFDHSKYDLLLKSKNDDTASHSQQLIKMSTEKNVFEIKKLFNNLDEANWMPSLDVSS